MVYKFCCYLDQLLGVDHADKYLDLVALGMIADMMDLRYFETKHLIQLGCENIRSPFIKMMISQDVPYMFSWCHELQEPLARR